MSSVLKSFRISVIAPHLVTALPCHFLRQFGKLTSRFGKQSPRISTATLWPRILEASSIFGEFILSRYELHIQYAIL